MQWPQSVFIPANLRRSKIWRLSILHCSELKFYFLLHCSDVWELGPKLVFRGSDPLKFFRHVFFRLHCKILVVCSSCLCFVNTVDLCKKSFYSCTTPPPHPRMSTAPTPQLPLPPLHQQIALGHYMTYMGSKCAVIIVMTN